MIFYRSLALAASLGVSACQLLPASYSTAEAPKTITLNNASHDFTVAFVPGSARLVPADAARLRGWAATGAIGAGDRVRVAAAGGPALAAARVAAISRELLRYQIVASASTLPALAPNRAVIGSERYLVTTPACPDWSKSPDNNFTNTPMSNFGCATATDLALMAASPADLAAGRELAPASGQVAATAVGRYEFDQAPPQLPPPPTLVTLGTNGATPTVISSSSSSP